MKTLRGRHKDGHVVIKLFVKPESGMSLLKQVKKFNGNLLLLFDVISAFPSKTKMYRGKRSIITSAKCFLFSENIEYRTSYFISSTISIQ